MESRNAEQIEKDISELESILLKCRSDHNKSKIQEIICEYKIELTRIPKNLKYTKSETKMVKTNWVKFESISFIIDDADNFIKIFVKNKNGDFGNVKKEDVFCDFTKRSFDLKLTNL
ncbi:hypothetical protein MHBO_003164, partial [Bonamia ostreae]